MALTVEQKTLGGVHTFALSGSVDEESVFPNAAEIQGKVVMDFDKITSINSVGIRSWLQWFAQFSGAHFTFKNCPVALVMQMNMVEGFLPENTKVESFYVPFYCESCDKEFREKFIFGRDVFVEDGAFRLASENHVQCSSGCTPELDTNEAKYFRFLLKANTQADAA